MDNNIQASGNFDLNAFDLFDEEWTHEESASLTQLMDISTQQLINAKTLDSPQSVKYQEASRFEKPLTAQEIKSRNASVIPRKTKQSNNWSLGIWREWAAFRNTQENTISEPGFPIPLDIKNLDDKMLDYWGQRFILEIRRKDGKAYPPNTLVQIVSGIQRYLRSVCDRPNINIFKPDSTEFTGFRTALDTRMKELHAQGIGVSKNSSEPITENDELELWHSGVFNCETAEGISNAVFFYNGKLFGFRGFQEHYDAKASQFEICVNHQNGTRYIKYTPHLRKNSQGGLKNRQVNLEPVLHFEQKDRVISIVEMYSKYLSLVPRVGPFYRKPLPGLDDNGNLKFSFSTFPQTYIKNMMKRFFKEAGIETNGRKITNHSARVVMSRSKHRSNAVQSYQREQFQILNDISNCLEPVIAENAKPITKSETKSETKTVENEGIPNVNLNIANTCGKSDENQAQSDLDETLTIHVPSCVKKMVIVKNNGKRMVIDV